MSKCVQSNLHSVASVRDFRLICDYFKKVWIFWWVALSKSYIFLETVSLFQRWLASDNENEGPVFQVCD